MEGVLPTPREDKGSSCPLGGSSSWNGAPAAHPQLPSITAFCVGWGSPACLLGIKIQGPFNPGSGEERGPREAESWPFLLCPGLGLVGRSWGPAEVPLNFPSCSSTHRPHLDPRSLSSSCLFSLLGAPAHPGRNLGPSRCLSPPSSRLVGCWHEAKRCHLLPTWFSSRGWVDWAAEPKAGAVGLTVAPRGEAEDCSLLLAAAPPSSPSSPHPLPVCLRV